MAAKLNIMTHENKTYIYFQCPACNDPHRVVLDSNQSWTFNGNLLRPTFHPSVSTTSGHYMQSWKPGDSCWCIYNKAHPNDPAPFTCFRCHLFVENGLVRFCNDSSHALKGQHDIPLPDYPDNRR
jgi:hypothetical protein